MFEHVQTITETNILTKFCDVTIEANIKWPLEYLQSKCGQTTDTQWFSGELIIKCYKFWPTLVSGWQREQERQPDCSNSAFFFFYKIVELNISYVSQW
jgi:hypothetical protein